MLNIKEQRAVFIQGFEEVIGGVDALERLSGDVDEFTVGWEAEVSDSLSITCLIPLLKIRDALAARRTVKILLDDMSLLVRGTESSESIGSSIKHCERIIIATLKMLGSDVSMVRFIKGSEFQKSEGFVYDFYKLCAVTTYGSLKSLNLRLHDRNSQTIWTLIRPIIYALNEDYLDADVYIGSSSRRNTFVYVENLLKSVGRKKRIHATTHSIPNVDNDNALLTAGAPNVKITDDFKDIQKKIKKVYCAPGSTDGWIFQIIRLILFPVCKATGVKFRTTDQHGSTHKDYIAYDDFEKDVKDGLIHPGDIKSCVVNVLGEIVSRIGGHVELCDD